jgi:hypothetical protein
MSRKKLSKEDRDQMIDLLCIKIGYDRSYFDKRTDEQVMREYKERMFEDD